MRLTTTGILAWAVLGGLAGCNGTETDETDEVLDEGMVACTEVDPYGHSFEEWSALWWQWVLAIPATTNPLHEGPCDQSQTSDAFFLAGHSGPAGAHTRECTVDTPPDRPLFFPLLNYVYYSCGEGDCDSIDPDSHVDRARSAFDGVETSVLAEWDGEALQGLDGCLFYSPAFEVYPPVDGHSIWYNDAIGIDCADAWEEGNPCGVPAGTPRIAATSGYWLMLHPPTAGEHDLHFRGEITWEGGGWYTEISYGLTVE